MSDVLTRDVVTRKRPLKIDDDDSSTKRFVDNKNRAIQSKVEEDIDRLGGDMEKIESKARSSDATLLKIREYLDLINTKEELRGPQHGIQLLQVHAKLCPQKEGLFVVINDFAAKNEADAGVINDALCAMYEQDKDDLKHLLSKLFDKQRYHKVYTAVANDVLKRNGKVIKFSSPMKKDLEEFSDLDSYL